MRIAAGQYNLPNGENDYLGDLAIDNQFHKLALIGKDLSSGYAVEASSWMNRSVFDVAQKSSQGPIDPFHSLEYRYCFSCVSGWRTIADFKFQVHAENYGHDICTDKFNSLKSTSYDKDTLESFRNVCFILC